MTLLFNVTDAIGTSPNHGITRTERRLARALEGTKGVEFVLAREGRLWRIDAAEIAPYLDRRDRARHPVVERFGVDPPVLRRDQTARRRAWSRRSRDTGPAAQLQIEPFRSGRDDTLVSVGLDWVHGMVELAERHVFGSGGRFFGMCYDLIPIDHPEWLFPADPVAFRKYLGRMANVASQVLCISECTQRDYLRNFPDLTRDRAPVIRLGADAAISADPEHERFAASMFDGEPYAIYCATIDRRKNHQLLYRTVREIARRKVAGNVLFVGMTGGGVDDLIDSLRHDRAIAGRIAHVTDCGDDHLAAFYRRAACAVYPSLYEGWGLGVTEALAHGKACLIASGSSLGEAGLGVCRELHPLRTREWVDALIEYLEDPPVPPAVDLPTWDGAAIQLLGLVGT